MLDSLHLLWLFLTIANPRFKRNQKNLILTSEKNQYNHVMRSGGINMLNCNDSNGIIMRTSNILHCYITPPPPNSIFSIRIYWVTNS